MRAQRTLGLIGTGDMGSGVAMAFVRAGWRVVANLTNRSAHSKDLATRAGVECVPSLTEILGTSELLLSIVPPAAAGAVARDVLQAAATPVEFVDCNAVAPNTLIKNTAELVAAGHRIIDVGIVGAPPQRESRRGTRFYVSGPQRNRLLDLEIPGIRMIDMGPTLGQASAIKMVYAGLNKGIDAMLTTIMLTARQLDVEAAFIDELESSQPQLLARMRKRLPFLAATAERFVPEMQEISATFNAAATTGAFHDGAAWLYRLLAESSLAGETRDSLPAERDLGEALNAYTTALRARHGNVS